MTSALETFETDEPWNDLMSVLRSRVTYLLVLSMLIPCYPCFPFLCLPAIFVLLAQPLSLIMAVLGRLNEGQLAAEVPAWVNDCLSPESQISLSPQVPDGAIDESLSTLRSLMTFIILVYIFGAISIIPCWFLMLKFVMICLVKEECV